MATPRTGIKNRNVALQATFPYLSIPMFIHNIATGDASSYVFRFKHTEPLILVSAKASVNAIAGMTTFNVSVRRNGIDMLSAVMNLLPTAAAPGSVVSGALRTDGDSYLKLDTGETGEILLTKSTNGTATSLTVLTVWRPLLGTETRL